jgi:BirA family biotin operon repressor/biotin-[acetyl-CoA-carboxylase] ligase
LAGNLVQEVLKGGLYTRVVGRRILYFEELTSTMDQAASEAASGAVEGTVVVAGRQSQGRGRFQRPWVSQPGNLLFSIVFYPSLATLPFLSIVASLATARAIEEETALRPSIKWPNDILLRGKKVCGLLVENAIEGQKVSHAVVGVGLNVALDTSSYPEIRDIATSLNAETGKEVSHSSVLRRLLYVMDRMYISIREGWSPVGEWKGYLETLGQRVEVRWRQEAVTGVAEDVDDMGHLMVRRDDGTLARLTAGEVTFKKASEEIGVEGARDAG